MVPDFVGSDITALGLGPARSSKVGPHFVKAEADSGTT